MEHIWERVDLGTAQELPSDQLLHVLTCQECRKWLISRLLDEQEGEETQEDLYASAWSNLEASVSETADLAGRRRMEAEALLGELIRQPPETQAELVGTERYRNLDLLDLLLENSHDAQLRNPAQAEELANLASRLAAALGEKDEEAAALVPRAFCLSANALRLQHNRSAAEVKLARAAPFLSCAGERAFYCRTAALLRWEEGRTVEALALLEHSMRLADMEGSQQEASLVHGLLGLLHFEENQVSKALPHLNQAWRQGDRELRPMLALRVGFALAVSLGLIGQFDRAEQTMAELWRLYPAVEGTRDMIRVYALEGRLLGVLGKLSEAEHVLDSVFRSLLSEPSAGDAALVALDLALVLAQSGKAEEIVRISESLEQSSAKTAPMVLAIAALMSLASDVKEGEVELAERQAVSVVTLRRSFRAVGLRLWPLPYA